MNFLTRMLIALITIAVAAIGAVTTASPASATVGSYCKDHHALYGSSWGETIKTHAAVAPDPTKAKGRIGHTVGYLGCRVPGKGSYAQTRYLTKCYTHLGYFTSLVLRGVVTDLSVRSSGGLMNKIDGWYMSTHAPVKQGDEFCATKWFKSTKWVSFAKNPHWRVWVSEDVATWGDPTQRSPIKYLDMNTDLMLTPFRHAA